MAGVPPTLEACRPGWARLKVVRELSWVPLSDFMEFVKNSRADDRADLQLSIDLGCDLVDERCGPTVAETVSEVVRGGVRAVALSCRAVSLTAIETWPAGLALPVADFAPRGQVVVRRDGGRIDSDVTVTYLAGAAEAPAWAKAAAMLIGQQWFKSRLRPNLNDPVPVGFLVPKQAEELMAAHLLAPGGFA